MKKKGAVFQNLIISTKQLGDVNIIEFVLDAALGVRRGRTTDQSDNIAPFYAYKY